MTALPIPGGSADDTSDERRCPRVSSLPRCILQCSLTHTRVNVSARWPARASVACVFSPRPMAPAHHP